VRSAIELIGEAAQAAGVALAHVVAGPAEAEERRAQGVNLAVFVATELVRDAFVRAATGGRGGTEPAVGHEPLVLLPGMLGNADLWDDVAQRLAGLVALRHARIDFDDTVTAMAETVLAAAPERFALAGHSLGAIVALAVAGLAPGRVTRLALLNASARPASEAQLAAWDALERQVNGGRFAALASEFARANLAPERPDAERLTARIAAMALQVGPRGLLRQLSAQRTRPDARATLPAIGCPTLVVSGLADQVCPAELQEELAAGIAESRLECLPSCGHMSPLEAPDRVASLLAEFIRPGSRQP
jgi:pimeloyl-ACP methyl ester carboxylesterase